MKKFLSIIPAFFVLIILSLPAAAANINTFDSPLPEGVSMEKFTEVVTLAARRKEWIAKKTGNTTIEAEIDVRGKHKVVVTITYLKTRYTITYKDSVNMKYNKGKNQIHSKYNYWVNNLNEEIKKNL